jgi:uncharacterized membrane protein YccF (DUF307 family)
LTQLDSERMMTDMASDVFLPSTRGQSAIEPAQPREAYVPATQTPLMAPSVATAAPVYAGAYPPVIVNIHPPAIPMIVTAPAGPPFIARALWYVFVGWWLSALIVALGYLLMITVIGIPVAFALFNRIPQALTLRARTVRYQAEVRDGITYLTAGTQWQRPWYWRALYFLLIGWWFGAVWLGAAWLIGNLIITLPVTFLMYNRTSTVMTLQRH